MAFLIKQEKAPSTFQSRTLGRAALPQNCQTTRWILESPPACVYVTLVTGNLGNIGSSRDGRYAAVEWAS
jgi:hypothetical protein